MELELGKKLLAEYNKGFSSIAEIKVNTSLIYVKRSFKIESGKGYKTIELCLKPLEEPVFIANKDEEVVVAFQQIIDYCNTELKYNIKSADTIKFRKSWY